MAGHLVGGRHQLDENHLSAGDKRAVLAVRDSLLASLAPLGLPFAVPRQDGRLMAAADNLTPYWGAYLPSESSDPRGVIGRLATSLNLPPEITLTTTSGSGALSGAALADRIDRYVRLHPYVRTLIMNVVNAGRAEIVADALLELQRHAATRDLTYDIRLCVIDPEAPEIRRPPDGTAKRAKSDLLCRGRSLPAHHRRGPHRQARPLGSLGR